MNFKIRFDELISKKGEAYKLSKQTGMSQGLISDYKSGKSKPSIESICKIAQYFNISTDYLLGLTDIPTKRTSADITPEEALNLYLHHISGENISDSDHRRYAEVFKAFVKADYENRRSQ